MRDHQSGRAAEAREVQLRESGDDGAQAPIDAHVMPGVAVTSLAALQGSRYLTTYAASKAYELILAEGLWEEYADHGVDALAYVVGATVSESWRGAGTDAFQDDQELSPLQARILAPATSADVAARLYTVLGDGPRQYSNLTDEQASLESAAKPRAEVVHAMADVTVNLERFSHLPKPPRYRT